MSSPIPAPNLANDPGSSLRIVIVAENTSTRFGGEAVLPWHYFRILRARGIEAWLVTHERTRDELLGLLPEESSRMCFLPDTWLDKFCWRLGRYVNQQVASVTFGYANYLNTMSAARREVLRLISEQSIDVVHQPAPVTPRGPSIMHGLGVPVVIGPMNGNMDYPPGFARKSWKLTALGGIFGLARRAADSLHRLFPGKLQADVLLVANERTRRALPGGVRGQVLRHTPPVHYHSCTVLLAQCQLVA